MGEYRYNLEVTDKVINKTGWVFRTSMSMMKRNKFCIILFISKIGNAS